MAVDPSPVATHQAGCPEGAHEIQLYLDGELAESERGTFEAHVMVCAPCRDAVAETRAFLTTIRSRATQGATHAPAGLRDRITAALQHEPGPAQAAPVRPPPAPHWARRWLRPVPIAAAGATALGLTAWFYAVWNGEALARELAARHLRPQPLEVQSNSPELVETWASDKVDFNVRVPRIARPDLALIGARLSHVRDRSAVYFMYGTRQSPMHRVSLIVYDDPGHSLPVPGAPQRLADHEIFRSRTAGLNLASWKQNGIVYSVIGDQDDDVVEFVRASDGAEPVLKRMP